MPSLTKYKGIVDYRGSNYAGWQRQPHDDTVQERIEDSLSTFYKEKVDIVGCGRTDAGVHAKDYVFHFEMQANYDSLDLMRINAILPRDIGIKGIEETYQDFHARFSCRQRTYQYHIHGRKNPFKQGLSFDFPQLIKVDQKLVRDVSEVISKAKEFYPFCKSKSSADHYLCHMNQVDWVFDQDSAHLTISSNRFLRGMVRLIVGTCLNVGLGKVTIDDVRVALDRQTRLTLPWSVPAEGLFLMDLLYD